MALAGPTAVWVASGQREARPLIKLSKYCDIDARLPFLLSYLHKIDASTHPSLLCPHCRTHKHTTQHLFSCPQIHTTLSALDLWRDPGASPGFGRTFFSDLEAMRFARVVRGHAPQEIFLKWCNLVRFGVYFDQILSLKNFKNYHFL